jgi:hypothetical protein
VPSRSTNRSRCAACATVSFGVGFLKRRAASSWRNPSRDRAAGLMFSWLTVATGGVDQARY